MEWRDELSGRMGRWIVAAGVGAVALGVATTADAEVRFEGEWPEGEPAVSVDVEHVGRADALRALADEAGWSLVLRDPLDGDVSLQIKEQKAATVLDAVLADGTWIARRKGTLVTLSRAGEAGSETALVPPVAPVTVPSLPTPAAVPVPPMPIVVPVPPTPPAPIAPPARPGKARDVEVFGNSLKLGEGDVVRDVTVMGGTVDISGRVTGDVAVFGGEARLRPTAHVEGDATTAGGRIQIDPGARVDGDLAAMGGIIDGADNAKSGGDIRIEVADGDGHEDGERSLLERAGWALSSGLRSSALLFVLGAIAISLAGGRTETLRGEIAARPMRSLALGLVGMLGAGLLLTVLCVTVIGIPFAMIGAVVAVVGGFVGATAALTVVGTMLAGHRTQNVYAHLAVGCVLLFLVGLVPWVGDWAYVAVAFAGFGAMVATRAAGLAVRGKLGSGGTHAYR